MSQHTPTPWYANGKLIVGATPEDGQIGGAHAVEDVAFIVRACNSHAALVAALQTVSAHYSGSLDSQPPYLAAVRDALAHTALANT